MSRLAASLLLLTACGPDGEGAGSEGSEELIEIRDAAYLSECSEPACGPMRELLSFTLVAPAGSEVEIQWLDTWVDGVPTTPWSRPSEAVGIPGTGELDIEMDRHPLQCSPDERTGQGTHLLLVDGVEIEVEGPATFIVSADPC